MVFYLMIHGGDAENKRCGKWCVWRWWASTYRRTLVKRQNDPFVQRIVEKAQKQLALYW